jgi:prenyltransferase beta subunit
LKGHIRVYAQNQNSFVAFPGSQEKDVRFVYCAFVILHLLDAFHEVNVEKARTYLLSCQVKKYRNFEGKVLIVGLCNQSYDYAFGQSPGLEAQGNPFPSCQSGSSTPY